MDSALVEFSEHGYGGSSVNAICSVQGVSKGIIYHYFDTKDALFLSCVEECFCLLTEYLKKNIKIGKGNVEEQLDLYFATRMKFFVENLIYQRIFCEAVIAPPAHLKVEIQALYRNKHHSRRARLHQRQILSQKRRKRQKLRLYQNQRHQSQPHQNQPQPKLQQLKQKPLKLPQ